MSQTYSHYQGKFMDAITTRRVLTWDEVRAAFDDGVFYATLAQTNDRLAVEYEEALLQEQLA